MATKLASIPQVEADEELHSEPHGMISKEPVPENKIGIDIVHTGGTYNKWTLW